MIDAVQQGKRSDTDIRIEALQSEYHRNLLFFSTRASALACDVASLQSQLEVANGTIAELQTRLSVAQEQLDKPKEQ